MCSSDLKTQSSRKKRRAIFDQVKVISNSEYKKQLQDTSDIVGIFEVAPRTKKAMSNLSFSGVGKYFAYPGKYTPKKSSRGRCSLGTCNFIRFAS